MYSEVGYVSIQVTCSFTVRRSIVIEQLQMYDVNTDTKHNISEISIELLWTEITGFYNYYMSIAILLNVPQNKCLVIVSLMYDSGKGLQTMNTDGEWRWNVSTFTMLYGHQSNNI